MKSFITVLFCIICLFCMIFHPAMGFALSIEEERILGQEFLMGINHRANLVEDDFATQFINDLGRYLVEPLETKHFPFKFYIIKDNTLNAFAAPGGHIFINSGLIQAMDNADELAAVMCHEIGHVSARHLKHRIERNDQISSLVLAGMLTGVVINGPIGGALIIGSMVAMVQYQSSYSRDAERQADMLGFKYSRLGGFEPAGMISVLDRIESRYVNRVPVYLTTHPAGTERMANVDILSSIHKQRTLKMEAEKFKRLFPLFKASIMAKCLDHREAERLFNMELEKDPAGTLPHFGLGVVYKEKSQYDMAVSHLQKALEGEPDSVAILRVLGEAYQMNGQDGEAISVFKRALSINEADRSTLFLLGLSYESLEQYEAAIHIYKKLTVFEPGKSAVYYHLGLSYGKQDNLPLAHYNLGLYFKQKGELKKAAFHFHKSKLEGKK